jgi:dTDP-4-dehydrorhamnose 3,5-epimerase
MIQVDIPGVIVEDPQLHTDERGSFLEIFRASSYGTHFVQANLSRSRAGVLRGLHYHEHQADLWLVVSGRLQVGLADIRTKSVASIQTSTVVLDSNHPTTIYIPPGVAHGFLALTDVELIYFVTSEYDSTDEHGIAWDDSSLAIQWSTDSPILSDRDRRNERLNWDRIPAF